MPRDPATGVAPFAPAALAASNVGTWDYDVVHGLFRCDAATAHLYGLAVHEGHAGVPFERVLMAIHPDDRLIHRARITHNARHGGVFVLEYRTLPSPRQIYWVLVRGRYDADEHGRVVRGRGIVVDISVSKREGFAEQEAIFLSEVDLNTATSLDRAAKHAFAARHAIDDLGAMALPSLRPAADALVVEIARQLGSMLVPVAPERTTH